MASGRVHWTVKASNRWYFAPQKAFIGNLTDEELARYVESPGDLPSESAGMSADDHGRLYIGVSAVSFSWPGCRSARRSLSDFPCLKQQNAILYADTVQSEVTDEINGVAVGGQGLVAAANYNPKTFVRSGLVQAADTLAILDGWLYFTTNQQGLAPRKQYRNVDKRRGPYRTYRAWIGRGPAAA